MLSLKWANGTHHLRRTTELPPITAFTMMCWVKRNADQYSFIMGYGTSASANYYGVYFAPDAAGVGHAAFNGSDFLEFGASLPIGTWKHVAITVAGTSGTNFHVYIDGVLTQSLAARTISAATMGWGEEIDGTDSACSAGALKVYDRVLSVDEINVEMHSALPVSWAGLNAAYPIGTPLEFLRNSERIAGNGPRTRWADVSGNNREFTETGTIHYDDPPPVRWSAVPRRMPAYKAPAAGGGVTATSTKALPLSGSAAATVEVRGSSTKGLPLGRTNAGTVQVQGASTRTLGLAGAAAATVLVQGQSTRSLGVAGVAAGIVLVQAASARALPFGGTATATTGDVRSASSVAALPLVGEAAGQVLILGQSSRTVALGGVAAATVLVSGSSARTLSLSGAASAAITVGGVSVRALPLGGIASSAIQVRAFSARALPFDGSAAAVIGALAVPGPQPHGLRFSSTLSRLTFRSSSAGLALLGATARLTIEDE